MRLYCYYTPSHEVLFREWFLPSLQDDFEIRAVRGPQIGSLENHVFRTREFRATMQRKIETWISAVEENRDGLFVGSDVDIQFFGRVEDVLTTAIEKHDICFQRGGRRSPWIPFGCRPNAGFFICRGNPKTLEFWKRIHALMVSDEGLLEQQAMWKILARDPVDRLRYPGIRGFRWNCLPGDRFIGGQQADDPPDSTLVHHATRALGCEAKIRQMKAVRARLISRLTGESG